MKKIEEKRTYFRQDKTEKEEACGDRLPGQKEFGQRSREYGQGK